MGLLYLFIFARGEVSRLLLTMLSLLRNPSGRTVALVSTRPLTEMSKGKGKAIPLQAWAGPEGFRSLKLQDFKTIDT